MRLLLNVIWFVFAGLWMAIGYAFAALLMFILIITIPFGVAALRIGIFALWPFGKTVVRRADAGAGSAVGNVLWFVLAGWWLILLHMVTGVLLCVTIIGIPLGLANFKLIPVTFRPFGRDIVSIEDAERRGTPPGGRDIGLDQLPRVGRAWSSRIAGSDRLNSPLVAGRAGRWRRTVVRT